MRESIAKSVELFIIGLSSSEKDKYLKMFIRFCAESSMLEDLKDFIEIFKNTLNIAFDVMQKKCSMEPLLNATKKLYMALCSGG